MIRSMENLIGYRIAATNGDLGTVEDLYFTDDVWRLRYIVLAVGGWLSRRNVLLALDVIDGIADEKGQLVVKITQEAVFASPDIDSDKPVSRQKEILLAEHFGWKPYWILDPISGIILTSERIEIDAVLPGMNSNLRSFREVTTYSAKGSGLDCYVLDMITDDSSGQITSLLIARSRDRHHPAELLPVSEVERIDWTNRLLHLKHGAAKALQPFDPAAGINARRIARFFDYLGNLHHTSVLDAERTKQ